MSLGLRKLRGSRPAAAAGAGAERHPVDDVQRLAAGIHRRGTADPDRQTAAWVVVLHDLHAGHLALDEQLGAENPAGVELRVGHSCHGPGDVPGPLHAVACHHDFRQTHGLGRQGEIDHDGVACHDDDALPGRPVPEHPRPHGVRARGDARKDETTVRLSQSRATPDGDHGRRERLLGRGVRDASADRAGELLRRERRRPEHRQEGSDDAAKSSHNISSNRGAARTRADGGGPERGRRR